MEKNLQHLQFQERKVWRKYLQQDHLAGDSDKFVEVIAKVALEDRNIMLGLRGAGSGDIDAEYEPDDDGDDECDEEVDD